MKTRRATTADIEDLQPLFNLVDRLHYEGVPGLFRETADIKRSREFLTGLIEDEAGMYLVAVENGRVIGLIQAKYYEQTTHPFLCPYNEIYIHEMIVAEEYQGRGVAQALMAKVADWAKEKGVGRLRLQVFEFNKRAQAFYAKQGFVTSSRHMALALERGEGRLETVPPPPHSPASLPTLIRPEIIAMKPYTPIVPFEVLSARLGRKPEEIVKLDANENPYGPSPKVRQALAQATYLHIYPDPEANELRQAISEYTGVPKQFLLAGMGADELIDLVLRVVLSPGNGVIDCPPSFGMYPFSTAVNAGQYIAVPRRSDFSLNLAGMEAAVVQNPQAKVLFVCSPNNPDGGVVNDEDLQRLLRLPLLLVLDEAYVEFTAVSSRINWVQEYDNLVVLRTFSKLAGLAGLRLGYGAFPQWLLPHLWKVKQPYNVNVAASLAALAALQHREWLAEKVALIVQERMRLQTRLSEFEFLQPFPSHSNFVLCRVLGRSAQELKLALEQESVFVRYFDKPGVDNCIRVSVGRPSDTEMLVAALQKVSSMQ